MKTIEVQINLDPINDGATISPERIVKKEEGALIIGTNGKTRVITEDDAADILDELSGSVQGELMGKTSYLVILNGEKILNIGCRQYFIGSAIIVKNTRDGIGMLSGEEFDKAKKEFVSRLITLVGDGQEFSAYELA